jgi:hypothetical protein
MSSCLSVCLSMRLICQIFACIRALLLKGVALCASLGIKFKVDTAVLPLSKAASKTGATEQRYDRRRVGEESSACLPVDLRVCIFLREENR